MCLRIDALVTDFEKGIITRDELFDRIRAVKSTDKDGSGKAS